MSKTHGGYDAEDLQAAVSAASGEVSEDNVAQRMREFGRTLGVDAGEDAEATGGAERASPEVSTVGQPSPPAKTIKATPKKVKKILGAIPAKILEAAGIELDDEDREALDESGEFLTSIFGFEFEVPAEKKVLHSRFWAITWVVGVAAMIFLKHRFSDVWKKLAEEAAKNKQKEAA